MLDFFRENENVSEWTKETLAALILLLRNIEFILRMTQSLAKSEKEGWNPMLNSESH